MKEQTTANGDGHRNSWVVEKCVYGRFNPSGEVRYGARITAGGKRFTGPWVRSLDEALEHRDILRARGDAYAKDKRNKQIYNKHFAVPEVIYFVQAGDNGPIKIGRTRASLLEKRLANLQIANPLELRLLGVGAASSAGSLAYPWRVVRGYA